MIPIYFRPSNYSKIMAICRNSGILTVVISLVSYPTTVPALKTSRAGSSMAMGLRDPYSDYKSGTAKQLSGYGTDLSHTRNLARVGQTYSTDSGFGYTAASGNSADVAPPFIGVRPTETPESILARLNQMVNDPNFAACGSNPSDNTCVMARNNMEQMMANAHASMDFTIPNTFAQMIEWYKQLNLAEAQVKMLNTTLLGNPATPAKSRSGLSKLVDTLNTAITQLDTRADGAYQAVMDTEGTRRDLFDSEIARLTEKDRTAQASISAMSAKMLTGNSYQVLKSLSSVVYDLGESLESVTQDAGDITDDYESGLDALTTDYANFKSDIDDTLAAMKTATDSDREAARSMANVLNATYKGTQKMVELTAQGTKKDFSTAADKMFQQAADKFNLNFGKVFSDLQKAQNSSNDNWRLSMGQSAVNLGLKITAMKAAAKAVLPWATGQLNKTLDTALGQGSNLGATGSFKALYLAQVAADSLKLAADAGSKAGETRRLHRDRLNQLRITNDENIGSIANQTGAVFGTITRSVANAVTGLASDVKEMAGAASNSAAAINAGASAQAANLTVLASGNAVAGATGLGDASDAAAAAAALSAARLAAVTDSASSAVNASSSAIENALLTGKDVAGEIKSSASSAVSAAETSLAQTASVTNTSQVQSKLSDAVTDLTNSVVTESGNMNAGTKDAESAMTAVEAAQTATAAGVTAANATVPAAAAGLHAASSELTGLINGTESAISSTASGASASFNRSLMSGFASFLAGITGQLSGTAGSAQNDMADVQSVIQDQVLGAKNESTQIIRKDARLGLELANVLDQLNGGASATIGTVGSIIPALLANRNAAAAREMLDLTQIRSLLDRRTGNITADVAADADRQANQTVAVLQRMVDPLMIDLIEKRDKLLDVDKDENRIVNKLLNQVDTAHQSLDKFRSASSDIQYSLDQMSDGLDAKITAVHGNESAIVARVMDALASATRSAGNTTGVAISDVVEKLGAATDILKSTAGDVAVQANIAAESFKAFQSISDGLALKSHLAFVHTATSVGESLVDRLGTVQAQQVLDSMNLTDSERDVFNELVDTTNSVQGGSDAQMRFWHELQARLAQHQNNVSILINKTDAKIDKQFQDLQVAAGRKALGYAQYIQGLVDQVNPDLKISESNLTSSFGRFRLGQSGQPGNWADDAKRSYSLKSLLRNLSVKNQARLSQIVEQFEAGGLTLDDAIKAARQVNLGDINSVQDAAGLLANSMEEYRGALFTAFIDSGANMDNATAYIDEEVTNMTSQLVMGLDTLGQETDSVNAQASFFANSSDAMLAADSSTVASLQDAIQQNQTAVNEMLGDLKNQISVLEGDMNSKEIDFESWIDSVIADEIGKAQRKADSLKAQLRAANSTSLIQHSESPRAHTQEAIAIQRDIRELSHRHELRKQERIRLHR